MFLLSDDKKQKIVCFENKHKSGCVSDFMPPIPYVSSFESFFGDVDKNDEVNFSETVVIDFARIPDD